MAATRTIFTVTSTDEEFSIPGDLSPETIVANYSSTVSGLRNMTASSSYVTVDGESVRKITFSPRTGTKG